MACDTALEKTHGCVLARCTYEVIIYVGLVGPESFKSGVIRGLSLAISLGASRTNLHLLRPLEDQLITRLRAI